ncbi:DarP family protein [Marinimicrococcus flavescens]|uniref:Uncharacterized protein n=1 Tax=Marinimicrococcus flavescens TaxID=3031815 RepID=A0AAP3XPX7_9PROT|nr:hypothetical protein [Marinimicrococcus flavescens]
MLTANQAVSRRPEPVHEGTVPTGDHGDEQAKLIFFRDSRMKIPATSTVSCVVWESAALGAGSLSAQEIVQDLRDRGLSMAQIAEITRVARRTLYGWQEGAEVRKETEARLRQLHDLFEATREVSLRTLYRLRDRLLDGGRTLGELLIDEHLDVDKIRQALRQLLPVACRYDAADRRTVPREGGFNPALEELPIATFHGSD